MDIVNGLKLQMFVDSLPLQKRLEFGDMMSEIHVDAVQRELAQRDYIFQGVVFLIVLFGAMLVIGRIEKGNEKEN